MAQYTTTVAVFVLAACVCTPAFGAMYRWIDENGVAVYSQTPPPSGGAVKIKTQRTPSEHDASAARERADQQRTRTFDEGEARKERRAKQEQKAREKDQRAASCEAARKNFKTFQNLGRRMIKTPDGRYLRLSEGQVEMEIQKAQMQLEENCH